MNQKAINTGLVLFLATLFSGIVCQAQNKCFRLSALSPIFKSLDSKERQEISPGGIHYINFNYDSNGITINTPELGSIKMSNDLEYTEEKENGYLFIHIFDKKSPYTGFIYTKNLECSRNNPKRSVFAINYSDFAIGYTRGVRLYTDCSNTSNSTDQNLCYSSPEDDLLIKFMRSIGKKIQSSSNSSTIQKPTKSSQSTTIQPQYGEYKLNGHYYEWNDWFGKVLDKNNLSFILETRKDHYIGIQHDVNLSTLSPAGKDRTNWSTRKDAFKISLPKEIEIHSIDDIIVIETNGDSTDPNSQEQILFIFSPTVGQFQCLRNSTRNVAGRKRKVIYYFSMYGTNEWSQIKARLMQELPYCANRIY